MEFYEVVKQILLVSFRILSKFNKTLLRILLCFVCEFHRQFSSLFDISRISLHCVYSFFFSRFHNSNKYHQIFLLKFLFEFNLNLVIMISVKYAAIQKLIFVLNFHFPDDYFDTVMYFGFNFGEVLLYLIWYVWTAFSLDYFLLGFSNIEMYWI